MARRKELKGVCNDLIDSFASRYNDLDGYWALGKFQAYLQSASVDFLKFDLLQIDGRDAPFPVTLNYYQRAIRRHLAIRKIPKTWVTSAILWVESTSPMELVCALEINDDAGRSYQAQQRVMVQSHDPKRENQRGNLHGPSNQRGE